MCRVWVRALQPEPRVLRGLEPFEFPFHWERARACPQSLVSIPSDGQRDAGRPFPFVSAVECIGVTLVSSGRPFPQTRSPEFTAEASSGPFPGNSPGPARRGQEVRKAPRRRVQGEAGGTGGRLGLPQVVGGQNAASGEKRSGCCLRPERWQLECRLLGLDVPEQLPGSPLMGVGGPVAAWGSALPPNGPSSFRRRGREPARRCPNQASSADAEV